MLNAKTITNREYFYGHKACGGCGAALAIRLALKVIGERAIAVIPPNCMSTVAYIYPHMPTFVNGCIPPFAATAAMMSGICAGAQALGVEDCHVVGFAGDGGTADIGLQALSGMIDRNDRAIYICYDNEAYMNTGVQKSGLTPYGMKTTNTPAGKNIHGSRNVKKRVFEIIAAHGIPYAATASLGYPEDYIHKVEKAMNTEGTSFIHVLAPCPTGWGTASDVTVDIGKAAVDCGLWYLAEYENGEYVLNRNPKEFKPIEEYIKSQSRFSHFDGEDMKRTIAERDATWERIRKNWLKKENLNENGCRV
ncbi:MAG: thiamine pyrophosphate-dependent enzyme [Clostridium sp.]|nr:thiamine pyrophosphate-dependent enzyme [Clostridium sp.]